MGGPAGRRRGVGKRVTPSRLSQCNGVETKKTGKNGREQLTRERLEAWERGEGRMRRRGKPSGWSTDGNDKWEASEESSTGGEDRGDEGRMNKGKAIKIEEMEDEEWLRTVVDRRMAQKYVCMEC